MTRLDADQTRAAAHRIGTAAVAASAGSGKTTLLVQRAADLVAEGAQPSTVLTLAFNRNAAATLRERLAAFPHIGAQAAEGMAATFHSWAFRVLREKVPTLRVVPQSAAEAARMARETGVEVPTARDLAKEAWRAVNGYEAFRGVDLDSLLAVEPGARERLFAAGWPNLRGAALRDAVLALNLRDVDHAQAEALAAWMPAFREARTRRNAVDFADMLIGVGNCIRRGDGQVLAAVARTVHLQVDEAQDGNDLRWLVARTVADLPGRSVMAVGDLRQSIAGFAGAQPALFRAWWDSASAQFALPRNYRSAGLIVAAGNVVAAGEDWNVGGEAIAARPELGAGSVTVASVGPMGVAADIAARIEQGTAHKDITALARTRAALELVAHGLRCRGLKVKVRGGGSVWKGMDGRHIRAYLDAAEGNVRDAQGFAWALNRPLRYVSRVQGQAWVRDGKVNESALYRDSSRASERVQNVLSELSGSAWAERVDLIESWLLDALDADHEANAEAPDRDGDRGDLVRALCTIARTCGSVATLDAAVAAEEAPVAGDDVVELSTIHQSKGDQWGTVFVTGVKEGTFPHKLASSAEELAEETRLLYVAVTRPVHTLVVDVTDAAASRFAPKLAALAALVTPEGPNGGGEPAPVEAVAAPLAASEAAPLPAPAPVAPDALAGLLGASKHHGAEAVAEAEARALEAGGDLLPDPAGLLRAAAAPLRVHADAAPGTGEAAACYAPAPVPTAPALRAALAGDVDRAEALTAAGTKPAPGSRFVPVTLGEFADLLAPHGFAPDAEAETRAGQRVLAARLADGATVRVYTTVPRGGEAARGLGEDSIKVALLGADGRPLARRLPYAARTRNWRVTLLARLGEVLAAHPACRA